MADPENFADIALEKGWSPGTQLQMLLRYIENQQSDDVFVDFLREQPAEPDPSAPVYKSVFRVTVLSDTMRVGSGDMADVLREIDCGDSIGTVVTTTLNAIVPPETLKAELLAIGNDGTFFGDLNSEVS